MIFTTSPQNNLGRDDGHMYSNVGTWSPWYVEKWYTSTGGTSEPIAANVVIKV